MLCRVRCVRCFLKQNNGGRCASMFLLLMVWCAESDNSSIASTIWCRPRSFLVVAVALTTTVFMLRLDSQLQDYTHCCYNMIPRRTVDFRDVSFQLAGYLLLRIQTPYARSLHACSIWHRQRVRCVEDRGHLNNAVGVPVFRVSCLSTLQG